MSPITHFLVGWSALERTQASNRDRALVVWVGLAPDLDGLGIVVDFATRLFGLPETNYYQEFHRVYGHGLPAALLFSALVAALAGSRLRAGIAAFLSVHLHFLCDVLGSRGNGPEDFWPIWYLAPLSDRWTWEWSGQWPLVSWQNLAITATLLAFALWAAVKRGYSPLRIVAPRADAAFVETLRKRFG
jgi:inner membrane protein